MAGSVPIPGPKVRLFAAADISSRGIVSAIALGIVLSGTGCVRIPRQSMTNLWNHVPTWHWPAGGDETVDVVAPPKVSANVARASLSEEAATGRQLPDSTTSSANPAEVSILELPDNVPQANTSVDPFDEPSTNAEEASPRRRIRELKEALTADAKRELPAQSTESALQRLHVDRLLRKAQELLKVGELNEARRVAQDAVELSDSVSLEFLPTEDRPNDLLREIDDRLELSIPITGEGESEAAVGVQSLPQHNVDDAETSPDSIGTVAANVPLAIHPTRDEPPRAVVAEVDDDVEVLPGFTVIPGEASQRELNQTALARFGDRKTWGSPGWESAGAAMPQAAPKPPTIDAIEPLPRFRNRAAVAPAPAENKSQVSSAILYWTDWLAVAVLAALLTVVGLALGIRRWRCGA